MINVEAVGNFPQIKKKTRHPQRYAESSQHDQRATGGDDGEAHQRGDPLKSGGFVDVPVVRDQGQRHNSTAEHGNTTEWVDAGYFASQYGGHQNPGDDRVQPAEG